MNLLWAYEYCSIYCRLALRCTNPTKKYHQKQIRKMQKFRIDLWLIFICFFCIGMLMTHKALSMMVPRSIGSNNNNQEASYSTRSYIIAGPLPEGVNVNTTNVIPNYHTFHGSYWGGIILCGKEKNKEDCSLFGDCFNCSMYKCLEFKKSIIL